MSASHLNVCGILGGTFDPVHLAHVALAEAALRALPLDEILWLPTGSPGHRAPPAASAEARMAMLRLATAGNPRFRIDDAELKSGETTYTVHSLTRLRAQLGDRAPLVLLLGADSFLSLPTWLRWKELFQLAHIAIADRPGHPAIDGTLPAELTAETAARLGAPAELRERAAGRIVTFPMPQLDISASAVRASVATGADASAVLSPTVLAYIQTHRLYRKEPHTN